MPRPEGQIYRAPVLFPVAATDQLPNTFADLKAGDHVCCLYAGQHERAELLERLEATVVSPPAGGGLQDLRQALAEQMARSSAGACLAVDMADVAHDVPAEALREHEAAAGELAERHQVALACLWDRTRLPEDLLIRVVGWHRLVAAGARVYSQQVPEVDATASLLDLCLARAAQSDRLRRHNRRHHALISSLWNAASTMILMLDCKARIQRLNHVAEEITGYSTEELQGTDLWNFLARSPDTQQARSFFNRLTTTGGNLSGETNLLTKSGRQLCVAWNASTLSGESGEVASVLISALDVTARREVQHALQDTTRQYEELVESVNSIIMRLDLQGRVTFINEFGQQFFGYAENEVLGREAVGLLFPEVEREGRDFREMVQAVLSSPLSHEDGEAEALRKDGSRAWINWSVTVMHDEGGRPAGLLGVGNDISEHKDAEARLAASERRFRELADMLPDMVYESDAHGTITYANRTLFGKLGYTPEDLQRRYSISDMVAAEDRPLVGEAMEKIVAGASETARYSVKRADDTYLPVEIHSTAIRDGSGGLCGFRGVIRDISNRQELEEAQRLAALGQLAAGVAHEFNNILAAMFGWAELARNGEDDGETQGRLIETVLMGAGRGADICKKLIKYARPVEPQRSPLPIEEPIRAALAIAERELEKAEISVLCQFDTGSKCVLGDSGQLQQVFLNLIINARHAMPRGGELTLTAHCVPGADGREDIVVSVSDTGTGISAADLPRIFEPFFTTKTLERSEFSGSGLGLSVSQSIVKAHGGTIFAASREGHGTTFCLRFAAHDPTTELPAQEASAPEPVAHCTTGRRLLIAEDEKQILEVLRLALTRQGHEVHTAPSTEAALSALQDDQYDLVITDLLMPGGGGNLLLQQSRQLHNPPPILLITGMIEDARLEQMMKQGVKACLRKPFSLSELMQTVDDLLSA